MNSDRPPQLQQFTWRFRNYRFATGETPLLMGIVNVTPDSFSDGGEFQDPRRAVEQGLRLVEDGADLLDVGGESTRPGAEPVPAPEELRRVLPVVQRLAERATVPVSIDTTKAHVAEECLQAGASVVNDVSGLQRDPRMTDVCCEHDAGVVCMHARGTPQTMQDDPRYEDCVREIRDYLAQRLDALVARGIDREAVVLDPGIGFGKTAEHNLQILSHVDRFRDLGRPVLVGHSRKRFLSRLLGRPVEERTAGTIGVAVALAARHVDLIRVHDVRAVRDALLAWQAIAGRLHSDAGH